MGDEDLTVNHAVTMLPDVAILKRRSKKKKEFNNNPLIHTHTHAKGETTWLLDGGQIGGGSLAGGIRSTWDAEMKDSLPITHDPARSSAFVRPHAPFE